MATDDFFPRPAGSDDRPAAPVGGAGEPVALGADRGGAGTDVCAPGARRPGG